MRIGEIETCISERLMSLQALRQEEESIQWHADHCRTHTQRAELTQERDRCEDRQDAVLLGLQRDLATYQRTKWDAVRAFVDSEESCAQTARRTAKPRPVRTATVSV